MQNFIIGILDSTIDYTTIGRVILIYFVALWAMFSFWVFADARKRFNNNFYALIFFLIVFIFNFPALIFYLIIRPEDEQLAFAENSAGGLNIPIANLIDSDGNVELTLNIRLNADNVSANSIKMNIAGDKVNQVQSSLQEIVNERKSDKDINPDKQVKTTQRLKNHIVNFKGKASKISSKLLKEMKSYSDKIEKSEKDNTNDSKEKTN